MPELLAHLVPHLRKRGADSNLVWITYREAARVLSVTPGTIQKMLARGDLDRRPEPRTRSTPSVSTESVERLRLHRKQRADERAGRAERLRQHHSPPDDGHVWLDVAEAGALLGRSRRWMHEKAQAEIVPATMHGRKWWFRREDLETIMAARAFTYRARFSDHITDGGGR